MPSFFQAPNFPQNPANQSSPTLPWIGRQSLYSHIAASIDPQSGRIAEGANTLPDEETAQRGKIRWAAGAMDGVMGHHAGGRGHPQRAEQIAQGVIQISKYGQESDKVALYEMLQGDDLLDCIDDALKIVIAQKISPEPYLHQFARFLAQEAPDRGPVKFAIALLGLIRDRDNRSLIMLLGKHEEFTLFTAVALANLEADAEISLYELAQFVHGWGRIQLVEHLADTQNTVIKAWMLREGYKNSVMYEYLAFTCAQAGGLYDALKATSIDRDLFDGCADIIKALISGGPAQDINDYPDAAHVISYYLHHFPEHPKALKHFLVLHVIKEYLSSGDWDEQERQNNGWSSHSRERVITKIDHLLGEIEWTNLIQKGLLSSDKIEFYEADRAANFLGLETWEIHWKRLNESPSEPGRWYSVMERAKPETIDQVLALAEKVIPWQEIATGPSDEMGLGANYHWHSCLDFILQDLNQFPGKGKSLIFTGLQSPVIRNRNMALKALASWSLEIRDREVQELLQIALEREQIADVKERMQRVLDGLSLNWALVQS